MPSTGAHAGCLSASLSAAALEARIPLDCTWPAMTLLSL